ncbi:MAG: alpha/beta hydrolase [Acidimicrobiales bacterium]
MASDVSFELLEIPVGEDTFTARACGPATGELVLLLHGFPQTSWSWRHQLRALGAAGYRAVAPDQRGYSPGARPTEVSRYRTEALVADVIAIADERGGHTFHLVGHDWGAVVGWQVAGLHPQRLRTLTSISVPHPVAFVEALSDPSSDQAQRSSYVEFFRSADAADAFLSDGAALLRGIFGAADPADVEPYVEVLSEPGAMQAALNWYRAADFSLLEALGPVTTPTMYLWSTDDIALGREAAEATAAHVEGPYRFEVLEGVSHWVAEEAPERTNELLLEHLASG